MTTKKFLTIVFVGTLLAVTALTNASCSKDEDATEDIMQDRFIRENIIGKWYCPYLEETIEFKKDGNCTWHVLSNGRTVEYQWDIVDKMLILKRDKRVTDEVEIMMYNKDLFLTREYNKNFFVEWHRKK